MPRKIILICGINTFLGRMTLASEASAVRLPFRGGEAGRVEVSGQRLVRGLG
jgi:hypothetical protein